MKNLQDSRFFNYNNSRILDNYSEFKLKRKIIIFMLVLEGAK
jgi:hypothetical protein